VRALVVVIALLGCGGGEPAPHAPSAVHDDADRYVSKAGGFSVIYPAPPQESSKTVDTEIGSVALYTVGVAVTDPGSLGAYTVTYADLPPKLAGKMLPITRRLLSTPPRTLVSERNVELMPGGPLVLEVVYLEGDIEKTTRVFEVGPRYYQLLVEYPKGATAPGMRKFFDSFRLM
jgi:hypothetical protein